jgi:non-homologous end joining protein Ku
MLDAKLAGEAITRPEPVTETPVVDLMEALRRSVADVQDRRGTAGGAAAKTPKKTKAASSGGSRAGRAPARKSA